MADRYKLKEILFFKGSEKKLKRVAREQIRCVKQLKTKKSVSTVNFQRLTFDSSVHLITNLRIKERKQVELHCFAYAKHCLLVSV